MTEPDPTTEPDSPTGEPITPEGIAELRAEVEELEGRARTEMAERIKDARELGDLKENADYHLAKDDQGLMEAKIRRLRERLNHAVVVEPDSAAESFAFGRTAEVLEEASGKSHTWTLVGATEANISEGRLSVESPVGRALLGTPVGDTVELDAPSGKKTYRVEKLIEATAG